MRWAKASYLGAGLLILMGSVLGWQRIAQVKLQAEIEALHARDHDAARLRDENQRLSGSQVTASELDALRADHAATVHLRDEIEALKTREKTAADIPATNATPVDKPLPRVEAPVDPSMIPASAWKNAGRATPEAALETALWAAVGGDMEILADTINLDATARAKFEAALGGLPQTLRLQYGTPEQLMALMVAKDMPSVAMKVVGPLENTGAPPDVVPLRVKLVGARGMTSTILVLQQTAGEWRLNVPPGVVDRYLGMLTAPPVRSPSAPE